MKTSTLSNFLAGLVLGALILGTGLPGYASGQAIPMPPGPEMSLPKFIGEAAKAHPLPPARAPQNPFLGPNSSNHDHNDTWMSDTYDVAGPLGREPEVLSNRMAETRRDPNSPAFHCPGTTMDSQGRLLLNEKLRKRANLQENITLIGVRDHIELWNEQSWEQYLADHLPQYQKQITQARQTVLRDFNDKQ